MIVLSSISDTACYMTYIYAYWPIAPILWGIGLYTAQMIKEKKKEIWLSPMTSGHTNSKFKTEIWQQQQQQQQKTQKGTKLLYSTEAIQCSMIKLNFELWSKTHRISSRRVLFSRLRRRQYDPVIIERPIGLVLGPSTALYGPFLKHCTLTNKAVGTIWRALSKPPQRRQGPDLCPFWLLVGISFSKQIWARFQTSAAQSTLIGCR